jgi:hypothetical protein
MQKFSINTLHQHVVMPNPRSGHDNVGYRNLGVPLDELNRFGFFWNANFA